MKKNMIALLFVSLFTCSINAGPLHLAGAMVAAGGAVVTGIKFQEEYSKAQGYQANAKAQIGGWVSKLSSITAPPITTPDQEIEQELGKATKFFKLYGKSIGWGTAAASLAVLSVGLTLR